MRIRSTPVSLALLLVAALPGFAQETVEDLPGRFFEILGGCPKVPTLEAVGGGGRMELKEGASIRIPYGVPYRFRHRLPVGTDFVLLSLDVTGEEPQRLGFRGSGADAACFDVGLPPLPVNRAVTLTESRGMTPEPGRVAAMQDALSDLRDAFFRKLYTGDFGRAVAAGRLAAAVAAEFPEMLPVEEFEGFAVLSGEPATPKNVLEIVRERFVVAAGRVAVAPHEIDAGANLARNLSTLIKGTTTCTGVATLTSVERARLESLERRLAPLRAVTPPEGLGALYENVLPVPEQEIEGLRETLAKACPAIPSATLDRYAAAARILARDDFGPLREALREARRLVAESFSITASEVYPGATTTLQRYGQVDIVNAFFFDREEVRLLATFSVYPAALRFGGEIRPHSPSDRFVVTLGYSLATPVSTDEDTDGGDGDGDSAGGDEPRNDDEDRAFAVGAGYRLNEFFTLGGGRWFGGDDEGWYVSFSGDLGGLPFLRELFARDPDATR